MEAFLAMFVLSKALYPQEVTGGIFILNPVLSGKWKKRVSFSIPIRTSVDGG